MANTKHDDLLRKTENHKNDMEVKEKEYQKLKQELQTKASEELTDKSKKLRELQKKYADLDEKNKQHEKQLKDQKADFENTVKYAVFFLFIINKYVFYFLSD